MADGQPLTAERTYGNWRRPSSPGIGSLGMIGTGILLFGLVVMVIAMMISIWAGIVVAVIIGAVLAPLMIRDRHGRNGLQAMTARFAWWRGRSAGQRVYLSGPLPTSGSFRLPGLLAASTISDARDSYGRVFGLVQIPSTGHYTAVMDCAADGAALVDQDQVDTWVAYWGNWLRELSWEPSLAGASVTVETAPDLGARLAQEVNSQVSPTAPPLARQALEEVMHTYPAGSAQVSTRIAVTYSAAPRPGAKRRTREEMAIEIGRRLPGLASNLSMTGAGHARPMSSVELAEAIRVAYDPSAQVLIDEARTIGQPSGVTWGDAGPAGAVEYWDHYLHDGAASITWAMSEAPAGEVLSSVLAALLRPHGDIARKRVTLFYRPYEPATAARLVERDKRDTRFAQAGNRTTAATEVAMMAAEQTAHEQAKGAGVVRFAMLVTATVRSSSELPGAAAAIDTLAGPARIRLRRVYGSQAAAFSASLPVGVVLPEHLRVPQSIRESM